MDQSGKTSWWLIAAATLLAGAIFLFGISTKSEPFSAAGALGLIIALAAAGLLARPDRAQTPSSIENVLAGLRKEIQSMSQQASLSDDARRVLNRAAERDLLCQAIEEDIQREDWDAATVLCAELANRFGYREEAEQFRHRVSTGRTDSVERKLAKAISLLDELIVQHRWDDAFEDAARIARLFPESPRAKGLDARVETAREQYKIDLERRFLLTAEADRVEEAMQLLQQLDQYLTPEEAERLTEVARGVIGKARENLGVRFKLAVHDHRWDEARSVGTQIIEQFPNTRMAQEVRQLLGEIRQRSVGSAV